MINVKQIDLDEEHILYDASRQSNIDLNWFDPTFWHSQQCVTGFAQGRASTLFFLWQNREHVLRHYHRGGMVANFIHDQYVWTGLNRTRAWREWRLLARLIELDLPAPVPVAARIQRSGLCYRADLITERITNTESLADTLTQFPLHDQVWKQLGIVIARFHRAGVDHADLNAHNILLRDSQVFLIDFDRGRIRNCACCWKKKNLRRLLRSLNKLKEVNDPFHFGRENWLTLMQGYSG